MTRKLVTVRTIDAVDPIIGADLIEVASIGGWKVVIKKGEFQSGDQAVYFEIDSFLPEGNSAWQFLIDKSSRTFEGGKGHKLRSIKLRGVVSQGLVLPMKAFPEITEEFFRLTAEVDGRIEDFDFSELLGVKKWEATLPACLQGQAAGLFPSYIRKTDQERCQNLSSKIFGYVDRLVPFDITNIPKTTLDKMRDDGLLTRDSNKPDATWFKVLPAEADIDVVYEVSLKLDGSSMTAFVHTIFDELGNTLPEVGVCSRNLQLKINDENADNSFVSMLHNSKLDAALLSFYHETGGRSIAVQGELMGPGIQGNRESLQQTQFFVYDIFDIDEQRYLGAAERDQVMKTLVEHGADLQHVPILNAATTLHDLGINSINELLLFAEGPSLHHKVREGLVFKRLDGKFSFKAISNKFLLDEKE